MSMSFHSDNGLKQVPKRAGEQWYTLLAYLILVVSAIIVIEMIYAPHLSQAKQAAVFPVITMMAYSLSLSEIFILLTIVLGISTILCDWILRRQKIILATPFMQVFIYLFAILMIISIIQGAINRNIALLYNIRIMAIHPFLYIMFLNLRMPRWTEKAVLSIFAVGLFGQVIISFGYLFIPEFISLFVVNLDTYSDWFALLAAGLVYSLVIWRILSSKFSITWLAALLVIHANIIMHIYQKPVVLAYTVILFSLLVYAIQQRGRSRIRAATLLGILFFYSVGIIMIMPTNLQQDFFDTAMNRYAKSIRVPVQGSETEYSYVMIKDLDSGRFAIWNWYLTEALQGWGFSPHGFGQPQTVIVAGKEYLGKSPHNYLIYYSYECGLIAGFALLFILLIFLANGVRMLLRKMKDLQYDAVIPIYAFCLGVIATNLVGLSISEMRIAWLFWFCVAYTIKKWNAAKSTMAKTCLENN